MLGGLLITIWFYSSRAQNCCLEVRSILGCDPITTVPCRGYEGDCAKLVDQFSGVQDSGLEGYECHQFPDDAYISDTILVAVISVLVLFPVNGILQQFMELSNVVKVRAHHRDEIAGGLEWLCVAEAWRLCAPELLLRLLVGSTLTCLPVSVPFSTQASEGWQGTPSHKLLRTLLGGKDGHRSWHWHFPEHKKSLFARRRPMSAGYQWLLDNGDNAAIIILWDHLMKVYDLLKGAILSLVIGSNMQDEEERRQADAAAAEANASRRKAQRRASATSASEGSRASPAGSRRYGEEEGEEEEEEDPLAFVEENYQDHLALARQQRWFRWVRTLARREERVFCPCA